MSQSISRATSRAMKSFKDASRKNTASKMDEEKLVQDYRRLDTAMDLYPAALRMLSGYAARYIASFSGRKNTFLEIYQKWESLCYLYLKEYLEGPIQGLERLDLYHAEEEAKVGTLLYMFGPLAEEGKVYKAHPVDAALKRELNVAFEKSMPELYTKVYQADIADPQKDLSEEIIAYAGAAGKGNKNAEMGHYGAAALLSIYREQEENIELDSWLNTLYWTAESECTLDAFTHTKNPMAAEIVRAVYKQPLSKAKNETWLESFYQEQQPVWIDQQTSGTSYSDGCLIDIVRFYRKMLQKLGVDKEFIICKKDREEIGTLLADSLSTFHKGTVKADKSDAIQEFIAVSNRTDENLLEGDVLIPAPESFIGAFYCYMLAKQLSSIRKRDILQIQNKRNRDVMRDWKEPQREELEQLRLNLTKAESQMQILQKSAGDLQEKYYSAVNRASAAASRAEALEEQARRLQNRIEELEKDKAQLFKEKEDLQERMAALFPDEAADEDQEESEISTQVEQERVEQELDRLLNRYKVLVAGGNRNLTKKLKAKYPQLRIWDTDQACEEAFVASVDLILFKYDSMGHKTWLKIKKIARSKGIPFDYLQPLTALPLVERDMLEKILDKESEEST